MGEVVRIGDRENSPNPISCTVQFQFRLPPAMLARAHRLGDWERATPGVVLHVAPSGEVRVAVRDGSEVYARRLATRSVASFLREIGSDKPAAMRAVLIPGNGECQIDYTIAVGSSVVIARAVETPELA
jgi:hypothetical protein